MRIAIPVLVCGAFFARGLLATPEGAVDEPVAAIEPLGRWSNGTAFSIVADRAGAFSYVGSGGTVLVCALDETALPRSPVAEIATTGFVFGLALEGNDLLIAGSRGGFFHADVSNPSRPGPARRIGGSGAVAYDVAVRGDVAAFAEDSAGVVFFAREGADWIEASRLAVARGRALGVALGERCAYVAAADGDLLRVDVTDPKRPVVTARAAAVGIARSIALTADGRHVLVAEDAGDLTLRDAGTLAIVGRKQFSLPANPNPGPQQSPKPETPLCVSRVRIDRGRAYVGLEGTELAAQISPFTPEFGAWRGEPHYEPRAAVAVLDVGNTPRGVPSLTLFGFADQLRGRPLMCWIKDVAALPNGDLLALDFVTGAFRFRPTSNRPRPDGHPGMIDLGHEIDTRAGAIDCVFSPTRPELLYAASDLGGLQILDLSDPAAPKLIHRVREGGGTFCAVTRRMESDANGGERPIDYVFINNFFRVSICRIDPTEPRAARMLDPLWITLPEAIRGKREYEALGLTPRSYRVAIDGDWLDIVATNTAFGWQRFSIPEVLAWKGRANIYATVDRPAEYANDCPPRFRGVTSPDHLADSSRLVNEPFARAGKAMTITSDATRVIVGTGAQKTAGGRGGRGGGAPFDGSLQYFDLSDPVIDDPVLGPLRFPRATRFFPGSEVLIGLALRGDEIFVADTAGFVRVVDFVAEPGELGPHGENHLVPEPKVYEHSGPYGRDSAFDVLLDGDVLHVAGWSVGYVALSVASDPERRLTKLAACDTPGLPISLALAADRTLVVAEHNAGIVTFRPFAEQPPRVVVEQR